MVASFQSLGARDAASSTGAVRAAEAARAIPATDAPAPASAPRRGKARRLTPPGDSASPASPSAPPRTFSISSGERWSDIETPFCPRGVDLLSGQLQKSAGRDPQDGSAEKLA